MWKLLPILFVFAACSNNDKSPPPAPASPPRTEKPTPCPDNEGCHTLWFDVHGKNGKPPNPNDLKAVHGAAGEVLASGKATYFAVLKSYPEGGYVGCIETVEDGGYNAIVDAFATFRTGDQTHFEPLLIKSCPKNQP